MIYLFVEVLRVNNIMCRVRSSIWFFKPINMGRWSPISLLIIAKHSEWAEFVELLIRIFIAIIIDESRIFLLMTENQLQN